MSWIHAVIDTYDASQHLVGVIDDPVLDDKGKVRFQARALTPLGHQTMKTDVIVELTANGDFVGLVPVNGEMVIVPFDSEAASRTGSAAHRKPFPLVDKLSMMVWDDPADGYANTYQKNLDKWVNSETVKNAPMEEKESLLAVHKYIMKGTLLSDVLGTDFGQSVLLKDGNMDTLYATKEKKEKDGTKTVIVTKRLASDMTVRFKVIGLQYQQGAEDLSKNPLVWKLFTDYSNELLAETADVGLCYVTGKILPLMKFGTKSILSSAANAKIFSVQAGTIKSPSTGYFSCYNDIFKKSDDSCQVSEEASQKMTLMLRWLLDHQAWRPTRANSNQTVIVWNKTLNRGFNANLLFQTDPMFGDVSDEYDTGAVNADAVIRSQKGFYNPDLAEILEDVYVLTMDSASEGRLTVCDFIEMEGTELVERMNRWHESMSFSFYMRNGWKIEAPSVAQVLETVYGGKDDKSKGEMRYWGDPRTKRTSEQLMRVFLHGAPLPYTLVDTLYKRMTHSASWDSRFDDNAKCRIEYTKSLRRACGIIRKYYNDGGENLMVSLDVSCRDRDYLYGRVLAYMHELESYAMYLKRQQTNKAKKEKDDSEGSSSRPTNAWKNMKAFHMQPSLTTQRLFLAINPYVRKFSDKYAITKMLNEVNELLATLDSLGLTAEELNQRLGPKSMLGYASQMEVFKERKASKVSGDASYEDADVAPDDETEDASV